MTRHLPHKTLLSLTLAAGVLGLSATAMAQGNTGPEASQTAPPSTQAADGQRMRMHRHSQHHGPMQSRHTERLEQLKADLKLAPEQEPAWLAFVARTTPAAQPTAKADRTDWSKLNTVQRLERMEAQHEAHSAAMKQRIDATRSFYAALNEEQKQVFDQRGMGGMMRTGMHGGHRMGMQGEAGKPGGQMHRHGQGMGHMPCQPNS